MHVPGAGQPHRSLPPIPAKASGRSWRCCTPGSSAASFSEDGTAAMSVQEPSRPKNSLSTWPATAGDQPYAADISAADWLGVHHQAGADAAGGAAAGCQQKSSSGAIQSSGAAEDQVQQQQLLHLCPVPACHAEQQVAGHAECLVQHCTVSDLETKQHQRVCWGPFSMQPALPGTLCEPDDAGIQTPTHVGAAAAGACPITAQLAGSSSPDLSMFAHTLSGGAYRGSHEQQLQQPDPQQQQQQTEHNKLQHLSVRSSSCSSLSSLGAGGGASSSAGTATQPISSTAAGSKSRLGRVTGSNFLPGPPDATFACTAPTPRTAAEQQQCGSSSRGATGGCGSGSGSNQQWGSTSCNNWALERAVTSCSLGDGLLGRTLRIHCATFNMGGKVPASMPAELLGQPAAAKRTSHSCEAEGQEEVDLYVFATQESGSISEWERLIASSLPAGGQYERLAWQTLRAIHLVLFASRRFRQQVLSIQGSAVATGIGNLVGNKGAVALAVTLIDFKLLFIGSHFAAHDDKVERRNADFHRIRTGLFTSSSTSSNNLAEMGAAGSTSNGSSSPQLASTLLRSNITPVDGISGAAAVARDGSAHSGSFWVGGATGSGREVGGTSGNNSNKLRAGSTSPRGWLSGLWDLGSATSGSSVVGVSPCHSDATDDEGLIEEMRKLRAASCPDYTGSQPDYTGSQLLLHQQQQQQQGQGQEQQQQQQSSALQGLLPLPAWCVRGTASPRHAAASPLPFAGSSACSPRACQPSSRCDSRMGSDHGSLSASGAARAGAAGRGLSFAEEIQNQLSFLKSFVVRRPSAGLLRSSRSHTGGGGDATEGHDVVFWVGDLNYRINGNSRAVGYLLRSRLHEVLHANDQLRLQQKKGRVFQGFQEGKIHFPPTFKFTPGTSNYSEQRVPSWTDRILWKVHVPDPWSDSVAPTVTQTYYTSVPEVTSSDHKPVVAGFDLVLAAAEVPCVEAGRKGIRSRCTIM